MLRLKHAWRRYRSSVFIWLFVMTGMSQDAPGYVLKDEAHGTNLALYGLGTLRLNYADIEGNAGAFERRDIGFAESFDFGGLLSLTLDGTLFHDYSAEGYLSYEEDRENNAPAWNGRLELRRDESYLLAGDQTGLFQDAYFTRYAHGFRGMSLHLESDRLALTTSGAFTRGALRKEELRANDTSGPYQLDAPPVVFDSESVRLEVRHRHDPNRVLESRPQVRGVDYRIDNADGTLLFSSPIEAETFSGDPVFIVVIYRTETDSSTFDAALIGTRAVVTPAAWGSFGLTYLSGFSKDPSLAEGFDLREEIYGFENTLNFGNAMTLHTEYALSRERPEELEKDLRHAVKVAFEGRLIQKIALHSRYQRTEQGFLTFANPDIDTDQQEFEGAAVYAYRPGHALEAGYRLLQEDLSGKDDLSVTTTHHPYLAWEAQLREHTRVYSRYEWIRTTDEAQPASADTHTHDLRLGAEQGFEGVPLAQTLVLTGEYQLTDFQDETDLEADTLTHQLGLRVRVEPDEHFALLAEQREYLIHNRDLGESSERRDFSKIGMEFMRWDSLAARIAYTYQAEYDLAANRRDAVSHTITSQAAVQLSERLSGTTSIEYRQEKYPGRASADAVSEETSSGADDSDEWISHSLLISGGLRMNLTQGLLLRARYEFDLTREDAETSVETRDDEYEVALSYTFDQRHRTQITAAIRVEPDVMDALPAPKSEFTTTTYLLSGARQLSPRWNVLAEYLRETEDSDLRSACDDVRGELGFRTGRFLTLAGGYHYSTCDEERYVEEEYSAHSLYIKLIGKL